MTDDDQWRSWIDHETIRGLPPSPWLVLIVAAMLIGTVAAILMLVRA